MPNGRGRLVKLCASATAIFETLYAAPSQRSYRRSGQINGANPAAKLLYNKGGIGGIG
jgi:hypothetical protein